MIHGSSLLWSQAPHVLQCRANTFRHSQRMSIVGGDPPGAAKFIAEAVECSPKTAQSWLDGESTPAGILDMRAMAKNPIYAALKREIAGMESTMDPRLQAKYQELHRLTLELAGG